jgi:hypothetical protein
MPHPASASSSPSPSSEEAPDRGPHALNRSGAPDNDGDPLKPTAAAPGAITLPYLLRPVPGNLMPLNSAAVLNLDHGLHSADPVFRTGFRVIPPSGCFSLPGILGEGIFWPWTRVTAGCGPSPSLLSWIAIGIADAPAPALRATETAQGFCGRSSSHVRFSNPRPSKGYASRELLERRTIIRTHIRQP